MRRMFARAAFVLAAAGALCPISATASAVRHRNEPIRAVAAVSTTCSGSHVCLLDFAGQVQRAYGCKAGTRDWPYREINRVVNNCSTRVWFHKNANNTGATQCFSPHSSDYVLQYLELSDPGNVQITSNDNRC